MKKEEFQRELQEQLKNPQSSIATKAVIQSVLTKEKEKTGSNVRNWAIVAQECMELGLECNEVIRGTSDRLNLLQEFADVMIACTFIQEMASFSNEEIEAAIRVKTNYLVKRDDACGR